MVQASEAWRANLRAEYILSQVGGRGRRRCGGEEDSDQRCQARCPAIFISKIFSQKIWPKNWGGSSNRKFREWFVCGSRPAPPRPPFVQMKNTRGVFLSDGIPAPFRRPAAINRCWDIKRPFLLIYCEYCSFSQQHPLRLASAGVHYPNHFRPFCQKISQKNGGGSPIRNFGEGFARGAGPAPPRPPFVQMKNPRGSFFPPAFRQRSRGARQQF